MNAPKFLLSFASAATLLGPLHATATQVQVDTPLGSFTMQMRPQDAPLTVQNFLQYIADGDYDGSVIHRSADINVSTDPLNPIIQDFVIQGGGFIVGDDGFLIEDGIFTDVTAVPTDAPIPNEPGVSNTRGTVAMAKLSNDPNSATSQWFVNVNDNSGGPAALDTQNGGFTVFADVTSGLDVVDAIAALPIANIGGPFTTLPILETTLPPTVDRDEAVFTTLRVVGDATGDAYVGVEDLDILLANWGDSVTANDFSAGDFNNDGLIGEADLDIVRAQFGQGLGASVPSVPEPASAGLILAGLALTLRRRR